ncbi:MAG: DUF2057 domain-containing protein [Sedimenticola sp.]|nr:DUF2057 domain-containing protein [Sedimenticola sp.]
MAEIDLRLADGVRLLALDGKEVDSDKLLGAESRYQLDNGTHQLLVEYEVELVSSGDEVELETSDSFILLLTSSDQLLRLGAPKIGSRHEFKTFDRRGDWRLHDASGSAHPFKLDRLVKEGFQLGRDYERELELYNSSGSVAAYRPIPQRVFTTSSQAVHRNSDQPAGRGSASGQALVRQMLLYWYNQADPDTRRQFNAWLSR